jgi:acetoacetyl-CoA synthetase
VTYFRAQRRLGGAQNLLRAWRRLCPDLTVVDVPGCHHDVLGQENVAETARRFGDVLRAVTAPGS